MSDTTTALPTGDSGSARQESPSAACTRAGIGSPHPPVRTLGLPALQRRARPEDGWVRRTPSIPAEWSGFGRSTAPRISARISSARPRQRSRVSDGTIWVTDVKNRSSIMQFSPDGRYLGALESLSRVDADQRAVADRHRTGPARLHLRDGARPNPRASAQRRGRRVVQRAAARFGGGQRGQDRRGLGIGIRSARQGRQAPRRQWAHAARGPISSTTCTGSRSVRTAASTSPTPTTIG